MFRLPCFVDRLEGFVLLWKRGETILAVGERVINPIESRASILTVIGHHRQSGACRYF
jgi:hypothetical protein